MLLLTSTNDRLQVITSAAASIDVHASWVDTSAGTITPGRTNTVITTATTTSVAGAPAASTQRNVKTLHIRNKHATQSCDVTVQHTDGTIVSQLYKATLDAGQMLMYTDQAGFGGGRVSPVTGASGLPPSRTVYISGSGTYTTPANVKYIEVELVGGGGGGSTGVTVGSAGTDTTFGTLTGSAGGGGGASGAPAGAGGSASGGQVNIAGGRGQSGGASVQSNIAGTGGAGGANPFGGAGSGLYNVAGANGGANTGAGGGGGAANSAGTVGPGQGGGAGGYVKHIFNSPSPSYSYVVGTGGNGAAASGFYFAAGNGAAGIIIITEHYN